MIIINYDVKQKTLVLIGIVVIAVAIVNVSFWNIMRSEEEVKQKISTVTMESVSDNTGLFHINDTKENTKPLNMTQVIIDHDIFKEVKGIPSTLKIISGGMDESLPPKIHFNGCFKTEIGKTYVVGYVITKRGILDQGENIYLNLGIAPMTQELQKHKPLC